MAWRQIDRKTVYATPFIRVYEDTIELDNKKVINDFSVVEFCDGVVIVATDTDGRLIAIDEYKYAIDKTLRILPAGGIEESLTPEETAIKELREETGYLGGEVEVIGKFYEHPSKLSHATYIARIYNAKKLKETEHEETELISAVHLMDFNESVIGQFEISVNVSALYIALKK